MKSLTMFLESESYFHKFRFSYRFQAFPVKCTPIVITLQNIGGLAWISEIWPLWSKIPEVGMQTRIKSHLLLIITNKL